MCPFSGRSVGLLASWYRQSRLQRTVSELLPHERLKMQLEWS